MDRIRSVFLAIVPIALLSITNVQALAQNAVGKTDSLCIHFTGDSRDILVELRTDILMTGTVPLTICSLQRGITYDLIVRGRGLEVRNAYMSFDEEGNPEIRGRRMSTLARNLVPGWGSINAGRKNEGWTDIGSLAATGLLFYREQREYQHIENRLTNLNAQMESATDTEEKRKIRIDAHTASRDLNVQNAYRRRLVGFASYIYGYQLIDPWLVGNPPRTAVTAGGSVIEIQGSGSSTLKAAFLSLIRPGRGQFYQAKRGRGVLFSLASTGGVLVALDYLNKYEEAVNAYEINIEYFETAVIVTDKQYFQQKSDEYWADVDKTRKWRNISYGVVAGIWIAGVIDAFIPGSEDAPASDFSLDAGPTHAALVYRF